MKEARDILLVAVAGALVAGALAWGVCSPGVAYRPYVEHIETAH